MSSAPPIPRVPLALTFHPHWVGWKQEERDGKPTKVPYQVTRHDRRASTTDPSTWATYEAAKSALAQGLFDGIGWVFGPNLETGEIMFAGIDIDKCIVPIHSDGPFSHAFGPSMVHADARKIVEALASYTELSPSGTGLHILVKATLDGGRNRTSKTPWPGGIEMYDRGRFFTITGNHLAWTPETIEARQTELDELRSRLFPVTHNGNGAGVRHPTPPAGAGPASTPAVPIGLDDAALEEKIRASKQGPKFAELFDRGAGEGQESEADLALCNILAFWIGPDPARIDAWFRRSALMREKWDDKRGDTTYGGYTIDRALEGRTVFYGQKQASAKAKAPADRDHDDPELSYADELAGYFGLVDDTFASGWRSSRKATCRVVLTTQEGRVFDVESWKGATTSARVLAQEIRLQLGTDPHISKEDMGRLDVLIGQFCTVIQSMTVQDRALELGRAFLGEAQTLDVDLDDQVERYGALRQLQNTHPQVKAKADGTAMVAACIVLKDKHGRRYVRISWFIDYVKANAISSQVAAIVEAMESPGMWSRLNNTKSRMAGTDPVTKERVWQALYEVPAEWGDVTDA